MYIITFIHKSTMEMHLHVYLLTLFTSVAKFDYIILASFNYNIIQSCTINYFCIFSGKCFVEIAEEMKEVYAVYCRNHDDAISLMEKVIKAA